MCTHPDIGSPVNIPVITSGPATCNAKFNSSEKVIHINLIYRIRIEVQIVQGIRIASRYQDYHQ
jgi:hypothetical protein